MAFKLNGQLLKKMLISFILKLNYFSCINNSKQNKLYYRLHKVLLFFFHQYLFIEFSKGHADHQQSVK